MDVTAETIRRRLQALGCYPTPVGAKGAERQLDELRWGIVEGLRHLSPTDTLALYVVVAVLAGEEG